MEGRPKVAYDPRDFSDDNETKKVPRLTLMEEVLLLGLKDKAVCLFLACLFADSSRAIYRFGMTTSRMPFVAASLSSWHYGGGSLSCETHRVAGCLSPTA